jgi:hypothetical protein
VLVCSGPFVLSRALLVKFKVGALTAAPATAQVNRPFALSGRGNIREHATASTLRAWWNWRDFRRDHYRPLLAANHGCLGEVVFSKKVIEGFSQQVVELFAIISRICL